MRIGCLQFAPQVGEVDNNLNRADAVLSRANLKSLDLLVLPELAFSGYNFKSLLDMEPCLEPSGSGITSLWARTVALKHDCYVAVGDGETIANYRKSFLCHSDGAWTVEDDRGFFNEFIPELGNTSIGICMGLKYQHTNLCCSPYQFAAPRNAFELAFHILKMESNLVIVTMAWTTNEECRSFSRMPNEPDMDSLTHWVTRLEPLIRAEPQDEIIVIFCNRTGTEDDNTYSGTSAVLGIHDGEVNLYGLLGRGERELLIVDTADSPCAKLIYRPEHDEDQSTKGTIKNLRSSAFLDNNSHDHADPNPKSAKVLQDKKGDNFKLNGATMDDTLQNHSHLKGIARPRLRRCSPARDHPPPPSEPAVQPPLPALPGGMVNVEQKPRHSLSIRIPSGLIAGDSGQSSVPDSSDIPTPSAPSPTPMAARPRLILPESPSARVSGSVQREPISVAAEKIQKCIQSVGSDEPAASVQSIKANPRPPEDSTPFPYSSTPLCGYPIQKRIYGGHVTVSRIGGTSIPATSVDDVSPSSSRPFWSHSDNFFHAPVSSGEWPSGRDETKDETKDAQVNNTSYHDDMRLTNSNSCRSITASVRAERLKTAAEALKSAMNEDTVS